MKRNPRAAFGWWPSAARGGPRVFGQCGRREHHREGTVGTDVKVGNFEPCLRNSNYSRRGRPPGSRVGEQQGGIRATYFGSP